LGFLGGVEVKLLHKAPLGDPLWLELRDYQLSFRKDIAAQIMVEPSGKKLHGGVHCTNCENTFCQVKQKGSTEK